MSLRNSSEYEGESFEKDYRERREAEHQREVEHEELLLRERLSEEGIDLIEVANGWARAMPGGEAEEGRNFHRRPMMPPESIDPETGCTAAEIKEEQTGRECPVEREDPRWRANQKAATRRRRLFQRKGGVTMTPVHQREVVKFVPSVPVEVALKYAIPGKVVSTRNGERVLFTLADDRVMFLDLGVARKVEDLGVNVREKFFVCMPPGGKKNAEWNVWRSPENGEGRSRSGRAAGVRTGRRIVARTQAPRIDRAGEIGKVGGTRKWNVCGAGRSECSNTRPGAVRCLKWTPNFEQWPW